MIKPSQVVCFQIPVQTPSTGAAVNVDSGVPSAAVYKNNVLDAAVTVTVTNSVTGSYGGTFTVPGGYVAGDDVQVRAAATVGGVTSPPVVVWQDTVDTARESETYARLGAPAGASIAADIATRLAPTTAGRTLDVDVAHKAPATIAAGDIATDAITAAAVKAEAVTKIQAGLSTYAGGAVASVTAPVTAGTVTDKTGYALSGAGVQAIWDALTSALTTAGSIGKRLVDYLTGDIFAVVNHGTYGNAALKTLLDALQTSVNNISNNTSTRLVIAPVLEIPDTGSVTYELDLLIMDETGNMEAPDSTPTVTVKNAVGTDRSAGLSALTLVSAGHYSLTYALNSTDIAEQLVFTALILEGGVTRKAIASSTVANEDITGTAALINLMYANYARRGVGDYATAGDVTGAQAALTATIHALHDLGTDDLDVLRDELRGAGWTDEDLVTIRAAIGNLRATGGYASVG